MPVLLTCSGCGKSLRVPDTTRGKKIRCPVCQAVQAVPAEASEAGTDAVQAVAPAPKPPKSIAKPPLSAKPPRGIQETKTRPKRQEAEDLEPEDFEPLRLTVVIIKDSDKEVKGQCSAEVSSTGLSILKGKKEVLHVPVGTPTEHPKGNRLAVTLDDREVEFGVAGFGWYHKRLARDLAAFLNGELPALDGSVYRMPWYLILPVLPPIGIPIMTLGGALPGAIGFGLAGACFAIMQQEDWPTALRVFLCLILAALGYVGTLALVVFLHTSGLIGR